MTSETDEPQVLRASDTVDQARPANDPAIVREIRPVSARPVEGGEADNGSTVVEDVHHTPAERTAILHDRYGGMYWGSDFIGFAVATFFTIVFLGIVGAIVGAVGYQLNAPVPHVGGTISSTTQNLGIGALAGSLIAVFLAYVIGGYTAGRMSRFDGVRNGFGVWVWTIVAAIILGAIGAILGNSFNVAGQLHLNVDRTTLTTAGGVSIAVTLVVMLLGALLGGALGARYHRRIERDAEALS